jgi:FSR family fosmidomycin resistance protein-like MFS transporter
MSTLSAASSRALPAIPASPVARAQATAVGSLVALACGHFAVDCCTGIWPVFKTLAHLDIAKAGLIATVGSMSGNALQVGFGVLADRGWRKHLLVAGPLLAGAVTLAPWASSYAVMFFLVFVTYVGSAAFHPSGTGAAAAISRRRTGFVIGLFLAGGYAGYSVSQLLFSAVYGKAPHLSAVILLVPASAALAIGLLVPNVARLDRPRVGTWGTLRPHLPPLVVLFLVQVLTTGINVAVVFLLPDLL